MTNHHHLVLIGMPGCGKSTLGIELARQLKLPLHDADIMLESRYQMSITQIFATQGERVFRDYESEILAEIMQLPAAVVSVGGGAILKAANRRLIKQDNLVLYLQASASNLLHKLGSAANRPLLENQQDKSAKLKEMLAERAPLYEECATQIIPVDGVSVKKLTKQIIAALPLAQ